MMQEASERKEKKNIKLKNRFTEQMKGSEFNGST